MYQMLGVFAEFERAIIVERVKSGLARAREQGRHGGRPLTPEELQERIKELRAMGHSLRWIAEEIGVPKSTVGKYCKPNEKKAVATPLEK
jgi:DNA invertase Pin-like site-specific DNA recombinase